MIWNLQCWFKHKVYQGYLGHSHDRGRDGINTAGNYLHLCVWKYGILYIINMYIISFQYQYTLKVLFAYRELMRSHWNTISSDRSGKRSSKSPFQTWDMTRPQALQATLTTRNPMGKLIPIVGFTQNPSGHPNMTEMWSRNMKSWFTLWWTFT